MGGLNTLCGPHETKDKQSPGQHAARVLTDTTVKQATVHSRTQHRAWSSRQGTVQTGSLTDSVEGQSNNRAWLVKRPGMVSQTTGHGTEQGTQGVDKSQGRAKHRAPTGCQGSNRLLGPRKAWTLPVIM
jgi:hypothetical protein